MTVPVREFTFENIHELKSHYRGVQQRVNPKPQAVVRRDLLRVRSDFKRDVLNVRSDAPAEDKPVGRLEFVPEDEPQKPMPCEVLKAVCARFRITRARLEGRDQGPSIAPARQLAMYLMIYECGLSKKDVGRRFERDHTTVLHGVRQISKRIQADIEVRETVEELTRQLRSGRWIIVTDLAA